MGLLLAKEMVLQMINEKKLAEIKDRFVTHDGLEDCDICEDIPDVMDTLSAALKAVKCLKAHDDLSPYDREALAPFDVPEEEK